MLFSTVVLLVWTLGGGLNWLDNIWQVQNYNSLNTGAGFIISLMIIGSLIDLPLPMLKLAKNYGFHKLFLNHT